MPFDHVAVHVPKDKFDDLVTFLIKALHHLGIKDIVRPMSHLVGLGETAPYLWFSGTDDTERLTKPAHIAFKAENIKQVMEFHVAGLKAGGIDNGAPGLRPMYGPGYYGAFLLDPAYGINFEVVLKGCPDDEATVKKIEAEARQELV